MFGPTGTGGPPTLVDRKLRFTIVLKIQSKQPDYVHQKIKPRLKDLDDEHRRSLTLDNAAEFAGRDRLEKSLCMELHSSAGTLAD